MWVSARVRRYLVVLALPMGLIYIIGLPTLVYVRLVQNQKLAYAAMRQLNQAGLPGASSLEQQTEAEAAQQWEDEFADPNLSASQDGSTFELNHPSRSATGFRTRSRAFTEIAIEAERDMDKATRSFLRDFGFIFMGYSQEVPFLLCAPAHAL